MSAQQVMRAAMDGWNEHGIEGFLQYVTPDVVWHAPPDYPEGQDWQGPEALAEAWHDQFDSVFEDVHSDLEAIEPGRNGHMASVRLHGRAPGSGIELD
jgi:ketosteroid isomerase-like protein